MAKTEPEIQPGNDEFSRIFSEYHAKIDEITRRTEKRLKSLNADQAEQAVEKVTTVEPTESAPSPETTEAPSQEEAAPAFWPPAGRAYPAPEFEAEPAPLTESAGVLRDAKRQAKKIVEEAEQKVRREAKKKTQTEVDRLLERAGKEAEDIVFSARQAAEKEKNEIVSIARHEAEQAVADITARCRQESQTSSARVIGTATEKAQKIMADVIESGTEINRLISEIVDRAEKTVADFEARLREETTDLSKIINETRQRLQQVTDAARGGQVVQAAQAIVEETVPPPEEPAEVEIEIENEVPTLAVRLVGEKSNGRKGGPFLFRGQVEMRSSSATDYQYLKGLKKYLVGLPDVKYLQEYASEKEMSVLFEVREPLPLLDVLRRVPLVENVVPGTEDDFSIIFKAQ